jgi:hypothetical protein
VQVNNNNMQDEIAVFYSRPQIGGGMPVYAGATRWGGGIFSSLARFALPLLKSFAGRAVNVAAKTASDVLDGRRPIKEALIGNTIDEVRSAIHNRQNFINKEGEGIITNRQDIFSRKRKR